MRKILLSSIHMFLCSAFLFASPEWLTSLEKVFPSEQYIRAAGEGASESSARKMALAALTEYVNQKISSQTFLVQTIHMEKSDYQEKADIRQNIVTSSSASLFGVEYTGTFYDERRKKYHVCAYIERKTAWDIILQKADAAISAYREIVKGAECLDEPLLKTIALNKAEKVYADFLSFYESALVIYPDKCDSLTDFAKQAGRHRAQFAVLQREATISITAKGDRQKRIESKIASILLEHGLVSAGENAGYRLNAQIIWNESESNGIYSAYPQIHIEIKRGSKSIASYTGQCEKVSAYGYDLMTKTAIFKMEELLEEHLSESFE